VKHLIIFEIDTDLGKSFSRVGLKHNNPDFTYEIADVVAYCNTKKDRISSFRGKYIRMLESITI
jgi:hypothetical protein